MLTSLQQILPSLSGDIQIMCRMDIESQTDNNVYIANVRSAKLAPLSATLVPNVDCNLLTSDYSRDIKRYYDVCSDTFYGTDENSDVIPDIKNYPESNYTMNYSWGCSRISSEANEGSSYCFFAPFWTDGRIPDRFELTLEIGKLSKKKIIVNLTDNNYNINYLPKYLAQYCSGLDSKVMNLIPLNGENSSLYGAYIFGLSASGGGFVNVRSILSRELWEEYQTVNKYDNILCSGFKDTHTVIKQIIPLSFAFNLHDILNYNEQHTLIQVSGAYYIGQDEISMSRFSTDYSKYNMKFKVWNGNDYAVTDTSRINKIGTSFQQWPDGILCPAKINGQIQSSKYHLNEGIATCYASSRQKEQPRYARWELCGNLDDIPYIINGSEAYNTTGMIGRYYNTPVNNSKIFTLDCTNIQRSLVDAARYFDEYNSLWCSSLNKQNYEMISHTDINQVIYNGIMYNTDDIIGKRFFIKAVNNVEGPVTVLSKSNDGGGKTVDFETTINNYIAENESDTSYYLQDQIYIGNCNAINMNVMPEVIGHAVETFTPVLARVSEPEHYITETEQDLNLLDILCRSYYILTDSVRELDVNNIGTDSYYARFIETFKGSIIGSGGYIEAESLNNYQGNIASVINSLNNKQLYQKVANEDKTEYIVFDPNQREYSGSMKLYKNISDYTVVDFRDISIDFVSQMPNIAQIQGYYIPFIPPIWQLNPNEIWIIDPLNVDEFVIKTALRLFNEPKQKVKEDVDEMELSSLLIIVWNKSDGKYDRIGLCDELDSSNQWKLIEAIYDSWTRKPLNNVPGIVQDYFDNIANGTVSDFEWNSEGNIQEVVDFINHTGFGFETADDVYDYFTNRPEPVEINIDETYRYDYDHDGFVDEPVYGELYITKENLQDFYQFVLKEGYADDYSAEIDELKAALNSQDVFRAFAPVRYKHDLEVALSNTSTLYLLERKYNDEDHIIVLTDLIKADDKFYINYKYQTYELNIDVIDGKTNIIAPDELINNSYLKNHTESSVSSSVINNCRNIFNNINAKNDEDSQKFRLYYVEDFISVKHIARFNELLETGQGRARYFYRLNSHQYPETVTGPIVTYANGESFKNLGYLPDLQMPNGIYYITNPLILEPVNITSKKNLPLYNFTGNSKNVLLRYVSDDNLSGYSPEQLYNIYKIPSISKSDTNSTVLHVSLDKNSFNISNSKPLSDSEMSEVLKQLIQSPMTALPFIKFDAVGYILTNSVPETRTVLDCKLYSVQNPDNTWQININDTNYDELTIYRYYGWCQPLLENIGYITPLWGRYKIDGDYSTDYDINPLFKENENILKGNHIERYLQHDFRTSTYKIATRKLLEDKWYNNSLILYLPKNLEYHAGVFSSVEIPSWESQDFEAFCTAFARAGYKSGEYTESQLRYLFFRYNVRTEKTDIMTADGRMKKDLTFKFTLI